MNSLIWLWHVVGTGKKLSLVFIPLIGQLFFFFFEYLLRAGIIVSIGGTALNETGSLFEGPNFLEKTSSDIVNKGERHGLQSS